MTKNPNALANALRKISKNSEIENIEGEIKQMFINNDTSKGFLGGLGGLFSTHPPIEKRIKILEQF
jgi:heat shock protein HtpX